MTPVSGILRLANVQSRPVGIHMSSWHSYVQWRQSRLVAVRSHFGLRLDGRNNPARASNRPGRRIKGGGLLPGWVKLPVRVLIVSDILDSEIHDRTRVLYSYSYLRGSYEIEADLTTQQLQHAIRVVVAHRVQRVPQL